MWQALETILRRFDEARYRRNVRRALALHHRGEVRADGLSLLRARNRLDVRWRARDIHPWDADVPERRAQLFHEQLVTDTEAAIHRLFEALPQIERIDLEILDPASDAVVLRGAVLRDSLKTARRLMSVRMRLQELGVRFLPLDDLR